MAFHRWGIWGTVFLFHLASELQLDIQPLGACGCRQKTSEFPPRALQSDGINNNDKKEENTEKVRRTRCKGCILIRMRFH